MLLDFYACERNLIACGLVKELFTPKFSYRFYRLFTFGYVACELHFTSMKTPIKHEGEPLEHRFSGNWIFLRTSTTLLLCIGLSGWAAAQSQHGRLEVRSSIGVLLYDDVLQFTHSPAFGLGAGYGITNFLQLNLTLDYSPTQQRLATATAQVTSNVTVVQYSINLRLAKARPMVRIKPFVQAGAGAVIYRPEPLTLDLGGGQQQTVRPSPDHVFSLNLGIGMLVRLSPRFWMIAEYRRLWQRIANEMATHHYLGLNLAAYF